MKRKPSKKKILLPVLGLVLLGAVGAGIWFFSRGSGEPVNVYPFQYVGMTEFWGDAQESYGPVSTDKIQTEFLSETQKLTEAKVKEGDTVKKGDVLFSFDTTLDALSLERKRLEVEKIQVQIKLAGERLQETREMVPYEPPGMKELEDEDLGEELKDQLFAISENEVYDGTKPEKALICWLQEGVPISDPILQELYETSLEYQQENINNQKENAEKPESSASSVPDSEMDDTAVFLETEQEKNFPITIDFYCNNELVDTDILKIGKKGYTIRDAYDLKNETYWLLSAKQKMEDGTTRELESLVIPPYPQEQEKQAAWIEKWGKDIEVRYIRSVSITGSVEKEEQLEKLKDNQEVVLTIGEKAVFQFTSEMENPPENTTCEFEVIPSNGFLKSLHNKNFLILTGTPEDITGTPIEYTVNVKYTFKDNEFDKEWNVIESFPFKVSVQEKPQVKKGEFYVVFKSTEKNFLLAPLTLWQGFRVFVYEGGGFSVLPFDTDPEFEDHTLPPPEDIDIDLPEIDPNALYTAEQILDMQKQCYATIKEQTEKLKLAEFEYQIMERELGDGNVYAQIDGKVISLLTEEEAREKKQPLIKVSGGGGFYVEGSVSELERDNMKIGQEVTVNDWSNGGSYTGTVVSIGDFPTGESNWNGMGNPTASYYPFRAFVEEDADLKAGSHVSISYSTSSAEQGIYLEKPFIRTEQGKSYVFVKNSEGLLEKRQVQLGKSLWGSYYEILSGLSEEDWLAFPYGKQVKEGAPTVESDISDLYSY